jgi:anaphase-promoting complex subunit 8
MPAHWMRDFFLAELCLEMQHNSEGLSRLQVIVIQEAIVLGGPAWQGVQMRVCGRWRVFSCIVWSQALSDEFPRSDWVVCQAATAHYNLRNFDEAQDLFEDLLDRDPHRIEVQAPDGTRL